MIKRDDVPNEQVVKEYQQVLNHFLDDVRTKALLDVDDSHWGVLEVKENGHTYIRERDDREDEWMAVDGYAIMRGITLILMGDINSIDPIPMPGVDDITRAKLEDLYRAKDSSAITPVMADRILQAATLGAIV